MLTGGKKRLHVYCRSTLDSPRVDMHWRRGFRGTSTAWPTVVLEDDLQRMAFAKARVCIRCTQACLST